jgi:transposase InsO family protein
MHVLYMQFLTIQALDRTVTQNKLHTSFQPHEKYIIASLFEKTDDAQRYFSIVSPRTIIKVWKNIISKHWTHKKRKPGRPPVSKAVKELILKLKKENFLWDSRRIRDELKKLSIDISHETISKILQHFRKTGDIKPSLSWKRFLTSNWSTLFACDFFTVTIFGMVTWYTFFIIEIKTRKIVQHCITTNPSIKFLRNQLSAFEDKHPGSTLIHDNSGELKWFPYDQYNFKDVSIVPYSPNMNAYAERFVRSVRQDCLDYFVIFTQGQLRRIIAAYIEYYNNYRPHQGLKGIPNGPPADFSKTGEIKKKPLLFGLHNHYYREAA